MIQKICLRSHVHCPCPEGNLVEGLCKAHQKAQTFNSAPAPRPQAPPVLKPQEIEQEPPKVEPPLEIPIVLEESNETSPPKVSSTSKDVLCAICGSQIFSRIDGPKHYKRMKRETIARRRCLGCRGQKKKSTLKTAVRI